MEIKIKVTNNHEGLDSEECARLEREDNWAYTGELYIDEQYIGSESGNSIYYVAEELIKLHL